MGFIKRKVPKHYAKKRGIPRGFRKAARAAYKYQPGIKRLIKGADLALKVLNAERQYKQTTVALTFNNSQSASANVIQLSGIGQGDGLGARQGNSIRPDTLTYSFNFLQHASATNTAVKMVIFKDRSVNLDHLTQPLITDMYEQQITYPMQALMNPNNAGRYQILSEEVFYLNTVTTPTLLMAGTVKVPGHIKYSGAAASDIGSGQVYIMFLSNVSANLPTVQGFVRLRYYDN